MLNRFAEDGVSDFALAARDTSWSRGIGQWSVIVPFYNESRYLPGCLRSIAAQTVRPRLILVDNGSVDNSADVGRRMCDLLELNAVHLSERRPGKVAALHSGLAEATSEFVATCDADTIYPKRYLETATGLLGRPYAVAAVAATGPVEASRLQVALSGLRLQATSAMLPQQCLNGGAGQVFRTAELRACGGFDPAIWNWVLEDHEVMARIEGLGRIVHHRTFHCHPADRPRSVNCNGWTLTEQVRYHLTSAENRLSFFHDFLAPRLQQRALPSEMLRRMAAVPVGG